MPQGQNRDSEMHSPQVLKHQVLFPFRFFFFSNSTFMPPIKKETLAHTNSKPKKPSDLKKRKASIPWNEQEERELFELVRGEYVMRGRKIDWNEVGQKMGRPINLCRKTYNTTRFSEGKGNANGQLEHAKIELGEETRSQLEMAIAIHYVTAECVDWDRLSQNSNIPVLQLLSWVKDTESLRQLVPMSHLSNTREWTQQQADKMHSFIDKQFGKSIDWTIASLYMSIDEVSCAQMYTQLRNNAGGLLGKVNWTAEEKEKLVAAVAEYPSGSSISWVEVAKKVGGGRSNKHCYNQMRRIWQKEAEKDQVWTKDELNTIETEIGDAEGGQFNIDKLCSLIPGKTREQVEVKSQFLKERLMCKRRSRLNQQDKERLFSLVDEQMPNLMSEYSSLSASEKAKFTYDHFDQIDWQKVGKALAKAPAKCKDTCLGILSRSVIPLVWTEEETERLHRAVALFDGRDIDWFTVSTMLGNKTNSQCRSKYVQDTAKNK